MLLVASPAGKRLRDLRWRAEHLPREPQPQGSLPVPGAVCRRRGDKSLWTHIVRREGMLFQAMTAQALLPLRQPVIRTEGGFDPGGHASVEILMAAVTGADLGVLQRDGPGRQDARRHRAFENDRQEPDRHCRGPQHGHLALRAEASNRHALGDGQAARAVSPRPVFARPAGRGRPAAVPTVSVFAGRALEGSSAPPSPVGPDPTGSPLRTTATNPVLARSLVTAFPEVQALQQPHYSDPVANA